MIIRWPRQVAFVFVSALAIACASGGPKPIASVVGYYAVDGCEVIGDVKDDDLEDLQKKAAKKGGNAVVVMGRSRDVISERGWLGPQQVTRDRMIGDVYFCPNGPVERSWRKAAASEKELQRDSYECQRDVRTPAMIGSGTLGMLGAVRKENHLFKMCMRVRGWELAPKQ